MKFSIDKERFLTALGIAVRGASTRSAIQTLAGVMVRAAVIKAFRKQDRELVDAVYSGVPAGMVGREQEVDVGPMSGRSNVIFWLEKRGLKASDEVIDRIFAKAKGSASVLSEQEILTEIDDQETGDRRQNTE